MRGFANLLAPIGRRVGYVVVSHSAGGVQSEASDLPVAQAMPAPAVPAVDPVFADSFEVPAP